MFGMYEFVDGREARADGRPVVARLRISPFFYA